MNRRRRLPQSDNLTPQAYRCPACCITARMLIVWPSWVCQVCKAKLVPADLHPRPSGEHSLGASPNDVVIELPVGEEDGSPSPSQPREKKPSG